MPVVIPICSSSKGNSVFFGHKSNGILADAGCSFSMLKRILAGFGVELSAVKAVVVTHEHSDHIKGLATLTKYTSIPVYATERVLDELINKNAVSSTANLHTTDELENIPSDIAAEAFPTPHDSVGSVGYTFWTDGIKISLCTDLGCVTNEVARNVTGSRFVFLEANYEPAWLSANKNYPVYLKRRIASGSGHLSNQESAEFALKLIKNGASHIVLGHLSQENNSPEQALLFFRTFLSGNGLNEGFDFILNTAPVINPGNICYAL